MTGAAAVFFKGEKRIATHLTVLAMTERQFTAHPVTFAITKRCVILSAEHERIRNTLRGETDCHSRLRGFAMTGERKYICAPYVFAITKRCVILSAEHERIRNTLREETDHRSRLRIFATTKKCITRDNRFFDRLINKNRFIF